MFEGLGTVYQVQRQLSKAQGIPVLGMPVSIVKGVLSIAEIITGFALLVIGTAGSFLFCNPGCGRAAITGCSHWGLGSISLGYSAINLITLGFFG